MGDNAAVRIWHEHATLETLLRTGHGTMSEHLGIVLTELGDDFLSGSMPVNERTVQPMRILHGGASVAFAETLASLAAAAVVDPARCVCVGQEINANHVRRAAEGSIVLGTARAFHIGSRSQVWGVDITDSQRRRVCIARVTMAVVPRTWRMET
jgi:1,4-dihydroxy-2-naphthoyl-CoA hydrolase